MEVFWANDLPAVTSKEECQKEKSRKFAESYFEGSPKNAMAEYSFSIHALFIMWYRFLDVCCSDYVVFAFVFTLRKGVLKNRIFLKGMGLWSLCSKRW